METAEGTPLPEIFMKFECIKYYAGSFGLTVYATDTELSGFVFVVEPIKSRTKNVKFFEKSEFKSLEQVESFLEGYELGVRLWAAERDFKKYKIQLS